MKLKIFFQETVRIFLVKLGISYTLKYSIIYTSIHLIVDKQNRVLPTILT